MNELEDMNEGWKKCTMVSFVTAKNWKMNSFISWHKWIDDALNNDFVKVTRYYS